MPEEKKKNRYTYDDVVRSNNAVAEALRELNETVKSARAAEPQPESRTSVQKELEDIKSLLQQASPVTRTADPAPSGPDPVDASKYLTSREQFDLYNAMINRRDGEFAEKQFISLIERLCEMREDFRRLVTGMEQNIDAMKASDVLSSFKTYQVDIENILRDAGVRFGTFGSPGQAADANLQTLVGVVETDDPSLEGTVAKRLSSGYEYKGRAVYKEKVMVYKTRRQQ